MLTSSRSNEIAITLHKTVTTTPRIQQVPASVSNSELARRYHVSRSNIAPLPSMQHGRSRTQHNLITPLSPAQEEIVVALQEYWQLSVDDLLVVAKELLPPLLSRSTLQRLLRRRSL